MNEMAMVESADNITQSMHAGINGMTTPFNVSLKALKDRTTETKLKHPKGNDVREQRKKKRWHQH